MHHFIQWLNPIPHRAHLQLTVVPVQPVIPVKQGQLVQLQVYQLLVSFQTTCTTKRGCSLDMGGARERTRYISRDTSYTTRETISTRYWTR